MLLIIGRDAIELAEKIETRGDAYVVVEVYALVARLLFYLVEDELVEFGREFVAALAKALTELVDVYLPAAVRVHQQEILELFVQFGEQEIELVERDFPVAILVELVQNDLHRLQIELRIRLAASERLLQLLSRYGAVTIHVHFVEYFPKHRSIVPFMIIMIIIMIITI